MQMFGHKKLSFLAKNAHFLAYFKYLLYLCRRKGLRCPHMTNDRNILMQIQTLGRDLLPEGSSLLLYGSRARGDNREDSDFDLVVLLDKDRQQLQDFTDYAYPFMEMGWEIGAEINPMLYTRKEWQERHFTPFYQNVEHDKIVLV